MREKFAFAAIIGSLVVPAAQSAPKKTKSLETYSALEPEAPLPPTTAVPVKTTQPLQSSPPRSAAEDPKKAPAFDAVPESLKGPLKERLALVEMLIAEHGRAYDYRSLTIAQLREILAELDLKGSQKTHLLEPSSEESF